ncbi:putative bifunctional diguanylate cyclase/phosphodiesterase [Devosia sp.]|uniref:putative bifunctional diguanylate cyclase/phosphodiesterase n=1 Tax=Devosia sp. TaxID=1871048 RepID=UPI0037C19856
MIAWIRSLFAIRRDNPQLMRVQVQALSRHIPLLYFVLVTSTAALAATHTSSAPAELTWGVSGVLMAASILRLAFWWRSRNTVLTDEAAYRKLRSTTVVGAVLGIGFLSFAISLYAYGDEFSRGHVAFYISVTVIACLFCLSVLLPAALALMGVVVIPAAIFLTLTGNPVFIAMALNLVLVSIALTVVMLYNFTNLTRSVASLQALEQSNSEMADLSRDNNRLANLDSLTGLPNRRRFFAELDTAMAAYRQTGTPVIVGVVDLDGFKPINDLYGHAIGDRVLAEVGRRLSASASPAGVLARLGGDEFAYIVVGDRPTELALADANRICSVISAPYQIGELELQLSCSIGLAASEALEPGQSLIEYADYALYEAKNSARGTARLFSSELQGRLHRDSLIEQSLRSPEFTSQLDLEFQPIFDVLAGQPIGFEALARWTSPTLGVVSPETFIVAAERCGVITKITDTLLARALETAKSWPDDMRLSFNLSTHDVASPQAVQRVIDRVRASGTDPGRIDFEITETAVMRDFDQSCASLLRLRALGCRIALDDFGAGYSSLSYVHRLPLDKIKVDRGFVREIELTPVASNIVRSILDLCRNLGLDCVIEGTENAGQIAHLTGMGCHLMQGYFIARPMIAEAIGPYLSTYRAEPAPARPQAMPI